MKFIPGLHSPAYPAAWLMWAMVFALATLHLMRIPWSLPATVIVYAIPAAWVALLIWWRRASLKLGPMDILFMSFLTVVLVSLASAPEWAEGEIRKYIRYVPFMMLTPYLCGRLMRLSDIRLLLRFALAAGMFLLPLMLLDRFTSRVGEVGRWPWFGQDHGALLVGGVLAAAQIALCVRILDDSTKPAVGRPATLLYYGFLGLLSFILVWIMARGWLIAGLVGVAVVASSMRRRPVVMRAGLFSFVIGVTALSLAYLPSSQFYKTLLTAPAPAPAPAPAGPILGEASCQPFKEGVNSVAIRWVLYQEAIAMLLNHPLFGVGAARFGEQSCTGPGGFPHSTILQSFAELGLIGGMLMLAMLTMAAATLIRPVIRMAQNTRWAGQPFILSLFAAFLFTDQTYGNYFMAVGVWLIVGIAASLRSRDHQPNKAYD